MPVTRLNLDNFPDSPYAAELRHEPIRLGFSPTLEREYLRTHLEQVRSRVRLWVTLTLALASGFGIEQFLVDGGLSFETWVHIAVYLPICLALTAIAWSRSFFRLFPTVAKITMPAIQTLGAYFTAHAVAAGAGEELAVLVLSLIALFFFLGFLIKAAIVISLLTFVAFTAGALVVSMPSEVFAKSLTFLVIATVMAAAVCRDTERSYRKRFLEGALIAEALERDVLTSLKNRRAFDGHLPRVWKSAQREGRVLAFLFIDVDYFKLYNDEYGHQAGDATLQQVAAVVQRFARRPMDIAARFGGEEFAVILYDVGGTDVGALAERLRTEIESLRIEHRASACAKHVTVSIGVAVVQPDARRSPQGALQLADQALYKAKEGGRNRCCVEGSEGYDAVVTGAYAKLQLVG